MLRGSYRGYSTVDKELLVMECNYRPLREVARDSKIPESTLRGWKNKFDNDGELGKGRKRSIGGGTKPIIHNTKEKELSTWVIEQRKMGVAITMELLKSKAQKQYIHCRS